MQKDISITIIIVTYNNKDIILNCLDSIFFAKIKYPFEIIVVDNASSDDTLNIVQQHKLDTRIIQNDKNEWFARANNKAMSAAKGKYILLLNSDAHITEGMIETLISVMEGNTKIAAAGPRILNADSSVQSKGWLFPSPWRAFLVLFGLKYWHRALADRKRLNGIYWSDEEIRKVDWISGCCMLICSEIVREIGGLDERFTFYGEEYEWCYRAKSRGFKIYYCGTVCAFHLNGGSSQNISKKKLFLESDLLQWKLTQGRFIGIFIIGMDLIGLMIKCLIGLIGLYPGYNKNQILEQISWQRKRFAQLVINRSSVEEKQMCL